MKLLIAKNIGFCSGVKRAIKIAEEALEKDARPVFFLGELVHNEKVIEKFQKKGIAFVDSLEKIKSGTVIIQAHGIPPLKKEFSAIVLRDATCPLVKRAQAAAKILFNKGCRVIIIGDKNHAETKGINGYAKNKALIINGISEAKRLPYIKKIGVVAQTTQEADNVKRILEILKTKTDKLEFINTLCPEVQNRQKEMKEIFRKVDGVLVIGSKSSANTKRLAQAAKKMGKKVFLTNSCKDLKKIENVAKLGIVSGTSTPEWVIEELKNSLKGGCNEY